MVGDSPPLVTEEFLKNSRTSEFWFWGRCLSTSRESLGFWLSFACETSSSWSLLWVGSPMLAPSSSCCLRKVKSPCELWGASWDSYPVSAGAEVLISSWGLNLMVPCQCWLGYRCSSGVSKGVKPRLMWRHGNPLCCHAVKVVWGLLSSWHRDVRLFLEVPQDCHTSHCVLSQSSGWQSSQCRGLRCIWSELGHQGLFELWQDPWSSSWVSSWDGLLLRCDGNSRIPLLTKQGNGHSSWDEDGNTGSSWVVA